MQGAVRERKLLMVGDVDLSVQANHRFFHIVNYISPRFKDADFISYCNTYGGPPAGFWVKVTKSMENLIRRSLEIRQEQDKRVMVVRRLKLPQTIQNLLGDLWAFKVLWKVLKRNRYEVCICGGAHNAFLIQLLKRYGVVNKLFYDDFDFHPDGFDVGNAFDRFIFSWKERLLMRSANGIASVSRALAELRKSQGFKNVAIIPNGVDVRLFSPAREKVPHSPTLVYMGSLVEFYGIDLVLNALPAVRKRIPDIRFLIIGQGNYSNELQRLTDSLGLKDRVSFVGKQPHSELARYLQKSDIGVAMYKRRKFTEYNCPLKIKEYMAAGLPVVTSAFGEAMEIMNESQAGELAGDSPSSIAGAIVKIMEDPRLYAEYSTKAIQYSERFDWKSVVEPFFDFISQ